MPLIIKARFRDLNPSEFELTDYVKEGTNKLAAQVFKWTSSSWCEDQDFYCFSGIYRDVYLFSVPEVHIYDLQIRAIPDKTLSSAVLEVKTDVWGNGKVKIKLSKDSVSVIEDEKALSGKNSFTWEVEHPLLWSAEDPQPYDRSLEVYDESGNLQEVILEKVGFRRFEMKNGIMTLNGKRIVFKGAPVYNFINGRLAGKSAVLEPLP